MPVLKLGFDPIGLQVGFMNYKVALREVFLRILPFFLPQSFKRCSVLFSFADNIEAVKTYQPLAFYIKNTELFVPRPICSCFFLVSLESLRSPVMAAF
jgi:hypothetical protein